MKPLASTKRITERTLVVFAVIYAFLVVAFIAFGMPWAALSLLGPFAASLVQYGVRFTHVVARGDGQIELQSPWRHVHADLHSGFTLSQSRRSSRWLLLDVEGRRRMLQWFGSLDEVDAWLKEAQVTYAI